MSAARDRAVMFGLAALEAVAARAYSAPVEHSIELRALLALLFAISDGRRAPYDEFWKEVAKAYEGQIQGDYIRSSYARTQWYGIARSLGVEPASIELHDRICNLARNRRPGSEE